MIKTGIFGVEIIRGGYIRKNGVINETELEIIYHDEDVRRLPLAYTEFDVLPSQGDFVKYKDSEYEIQTIVHNGRDQLVELHVNYIQEVMPDEIEILKLENELYQQKHKMLREALYEHIRRGVHYEQSYYEAQNRFINLEGKLWCRIGKFLRLL